MSTSARMMAPRQPATITPALVGLPQLAGPPKAASTCKSNKRENGFKNSAE